jgi:hypothetical protein
MHRCRQRRRDGEPEIVYYNGFRGVGARPATPSTTPCAALQLHELCLFELGVHLGEMCRLGPLAEWLRANGRSRFLLTAPRLCVPGAVGSPANGLATV